ncbi:MAG: hypothetical protein JNM75_10470, partial [Rhodospirillales bacterium]|nr:hypothetical protein [Rhodospirillales bacterium]
MRRPPLPGFHRSFLIVFALLLMAAVSVPATAQTSRPTAMTCDRYKKELSLAITKRRRIDADARAEL